MSKPKIEKSSAILPISFLWHNQANLLTIYYHFPNIVYGQKIVHFRHHKSKTNVNRKRYSLTVDSFQKRIFCVTFTVLQFLKSKNIAWFLLLSLQDVWWYAASCPQGDALGYGSHWAFSPPLIVWNSMCSVDS